MEGVAWIWLVGPRTKVLEVHHQGEDGRYAKQVEHRGNAVVSVCPEVNDRPDRNLLPRVLQSDQADTCSGTLKDGQG